MCRLRRHKSPGPAPAGGPPWCTPQKSAEEGRSRGLPPVPLRNPREYLAITHKLPPLPTGTQAEGSIQVAGAPNNAHRMARRGRTAENNARSGRSHACARARRSRAVFRLPVGAARHAKAAVPSRAHFRYGTGDSRVEALRPRRGGGRDAVSPFADPWTGRRRLWPKANRRRRWGRRGEAPRALLWFLSWARKKGTRCRSTTDKLRRSMSGNLRPLSAYHRHTPSLPERQN